MKKPSRQTDAFFTFFAPSANPFFGRSGKRAGSRPVGTQEIAAPSVAWPSGVSPLWRPERLWTWSVLFALVAGILFCRQPAAILHPGFVAEDGTIFFQEGYVLGPWSLLLYSHAGYLQVLPRTVAALASLFPLSLAPAVYAAMSLGIAAGSFTFFYAAAFRPLVRSDLVRIGVILLMCLMPCGDTLMRVTALPWYGLWFLILVLLMVLPRGAWQRGVLFAAASLAVWSTPVAIMCLPVMGLRIWRAANREERLWWTALALSVVGYALTTERAAVQASLVAPGQAALAIVHAITYRVFCYFYLGAALAKPLPAAGWGTAVWVALPLAIGSGLGAIWVTRKNLRARADGGGSSGVAWAGAAVWYLLLALPILFVLRPQNMPEFLVFTERSWYWHGRYFFPSLLLLCVFSGMMLDAALRAGWGASRINSPIGRVLIVVLLLGWASLHLPGFSLWDWHRGPGWKHFAREIQAAEARVNETGVQERVHIPADTDAWSFDVIVKKKSRPAATR